MNRILISFSFFFGSIMLFCVGFSFAQTEQFLIHSQDSRIELSDGDSDQFFYTALFLPDAKIYSGENDSVEVNICRIPENEETIWNRTDISGLDLTSDEDINRWIERVYNTPFGLPKEQQVSLLQEKNIINTPFERIDEEINRAEFLKIVLESKMLKEDIDFSQYNNCFADVGEEWFSPYVCYAKEKGYVNGYHSDSINAQSVFKPERSINYAESIKILYEVFGDGGKETPHSDDWWAAYDEDYSETIKYIPYQGSHLIQRDEMVYLIVPYLQSKHSDVLAIDLESEKAHQMREKIKENASRKSMVAEGDCTEMKTYLVPSETSEFQTFSLSAAVQDFRQPFGLFAIYIEDGKYLNSSARYFGVMNVGILQKNSENNKLFWAFDIRTGEPLSGLEIQEKDLNLKKKIVGSAGSKSDYFPVLGNEPNFRTKENIVNVLRTNNALVLGTTNEEGVLQLSQSADDQKDFVIVQGEGYWGVHYSDWDESMNMKRYPNQWSRGENNQVVGKIYTDRSIFRPGHTINFKGFLKEMDNPKKMGLSNLPVSTPITVELREGGYRGDIVQSQDVEVGQNSSFDGRFILPEDISLGEFYITLVLPEQYTYSYYNLSSSVQIEEYKRPTFFVEAQADKHEYFAGETATVNISSARYYGASLEEVAGEYTIYSSPYYPTDTQDPDYKTLNTECGYFCYYNLHQIDSGAVYLDANGQGSIEIPVFLENDYEVQNQTFIVEITLRDEKGEEVTQKTSFLAFLDSGSDDSIRPALKVDRIISEGDVVRIDMKSKDYRLKNVGNKNLTVSFLKEDEECELLKDISRGERMNCEETQKEIATEVVMTNNEGYGNLPYRFEESGLYTIQVEGTGEHVVSERVWVIPVDKHRGEDIDEETNHALSLSLDKDTYQIGETARLLIRSPFPSAKAFVSFESDSVFSSQSIDIHGNYHVYEFTVTEGMQPNINIGAFVVEKTSRGVPRFKLGYENIHISLEDKKMDVILETAKEQYEVHEEITLSINTNNFLGNGIPAEVSVAVVDESLVRMAGQVDTHVLPSFFPRRYLTITNSTNLLAFLHDNYFSTFGGAGKGGRGSGIPPIREDFKEVLYWNPSVQVPNNGTIDIAFDSGEMTTSYVILVSGVSTNGKHQSGFSDTSITVSKDFSLQPDLPRFVREGDSIDLPFVVFNNVVTSQNITATLEVSGAVNTSFTQDIFVDARKSERIAFPIEIPEDTDVSDLTVVASIVGGTGKADSIKIEIPVLGNESSTQAYQHYQLRSSGYIEFPKFVTEAGTEIESFTLRMSNSALSGLKGRMEKLITYPYGCAEQTISSTLPNAIVSRIQKELGESFSEAKKNTLSGLKRIEDFQSYDGGFALWKGGGSDIWVSLIVGNGLIEIEESGYTIPSDMKENVISYFENIVSGKSKENNTRFARIRSLSALASLDAQKANGYLDSALEQWDILSGIEKIELAYAFAKISKKIPERYNKELFDQFELEISDLDTYEKAMKDIHPDKYYAVKHLKNSYPAYFFMARLSLNENFEGRDEMMQQVVNGSDGNPYYFSSLSEARKFLAVYKYSQVVEDSLVGSVVLNIGGLQKTVVFNTDI